MSVFNPGIVYEYFSDLTEKQIQQFNQLGELYLSWNAQINVISRKDIESLYLKHVLHSLGIAKVMPFKPGERVLDVGTGGGFPGIPLAIMFPETSFHLVDSIGKKIKVVQGVAEALGLENVKASHSRAEQIKGKFNFVVSRAVTRLIDFYPWVVNKFDPVPINKLPNGILYLKGGDLTEEIEETGLKNVELFPLKAYFQDEFFDTKYVVYCPAQ